MKNPLTSLAQFIALRLVRLYQVTLSLDHGIFKNVFPYGYCRFHPTCSEYTYQAITKYGVVKGGWLGFKRLLHCHPWNPGGDDPLI